jgi:hypothetical protein
MSSKRTLIKWGVGCKPKDGFGLILLGGLYENRQDANREGYRAAKSLGTSWPKMRDKGWGVFAYVVTVSCEKRFKTMSEAKKAVGDLDVSLATVESQA